ncbi:hypothetical protein ACIQBJ_06455 [Kitasatospora sp. NPDC088391]|uniref:hypothetical protein n=1 Tax=Kitasatospora sp. NPDC088391 TaxID=3364074 RepID=UPI003804ABD4
MTDLSQSVHLLDPWPAERSRPFNNSLAAGPFPVDVAVRADGNTWSCAGGTLPVEVAVGPDGRLSFAEWD